MGCGGDSMMMIAAVIIHSAFAGTFGILSYSLIVNAGYGFWAGLIGFVCGVALYGAILVTVALVVAGILDWLDRQ